VKHPLQPELALGPEAPPREMVVAGPDLARTIGELRAAGYEVAAMDIKGATYRLHVRRVALVRSQDVTAQPTRRNIPSARPARGTPPMLRKLLPPAQTGIRGAPFLSRDTP